MQERETDADKNGNGAHLCLFSLVMIVVAIFGAFELLDPGICHFPEAGWGFHPTACFEYWLNRYQTLVGGLFAIAAAGIAYVGVRQQIDAAQASQREQQRRENTAARALLPLALATIVDYITQSANVVRQIDRDVTEPVELGVFPLAATVELQSCLRWADPPEAEQIWQLLASIQVFQSRYGRPFKGMEREQCQIDLCDLLTKAERLFDHGRNGHLKPKMTTGEIDHAITLLRLELVTDSLLDRYRSSGPPDQDEGDFIIDETEVEQDP